MSPEEKKIEERALLLARLYDREGLFKIGKERGIQFFESFRNPYEIRDKKQAAAEISARLSDNQLLKIIEEHPPASYYLQELGGFRGDFYTTTEQGKVELRSSWSEVRNAVKLALERYGENAYGYLQALVNKGGNSSFFELVGETERILGRGVWNPVLLRRLSVYPFKLVFKTGSRRYPTWTIPPEISPVVEEELSRYHKSSR